MQKSQKIWLWVFLIMFFVPEIFFFFLTSWIPGVSQLTDNHFFYERFINPQFFIDNSIYLFIALGVEFLGALGFLIWNVKFNNYRYKILLTVISTLVLIFLLIIFFIGYSVTNMSFP